MESSDVLATVAIIAAILSAIYSHRLSRRAHNVSIYYGVIALFKEIDRIFIEYPEVRPYFYDGKPVDVDDASRERVRAVAELVLDTFEWIWHRQKELNTKDETGWSSYIVETFSSSPALQQHYRGSASWYPGITRLVNDRKISLAEGTAKRPRGEGRDGGVPPARAVVPQRGTPERPPPGRIP